MTTSLKKICISVSGYIDTILLIVSIFIYNLILYYYLNIPGEVLLRFAILNISIVLPGMLLTTKIRLTFSQMGFFCFSYATGYALIILEYFICAGFKGIITYKMIHLFVIIICVVDGFRHGSNVTSVIKQYKKNENSVLCSIFISIYILFGIFSYAAIHLGPDIIQSLDIHRDLQYWMNNSVSLKLGFPAKLLFFDGMSLKYHYFSSIEVAFLSDVFNIDVFTMSIPLYVFGKSILFISGTTFLFDIVKINKMTMIAGYFLINLTLGVEKVSCAGFLNRVLIRPFGFDIGFAYGMLFTGLFIKLCSNNSKSEGKTIYFLTTLFFAMCCGAKAPIAAILLVVVAIECAKSIIYRQRVLKTLCLGLGLLLIFVVIAKYCVGMFDVIEGQSSWQVGRTDEVMELFVWPGNLSGLENILYSIGLKNKILMKVIRIICINPLIVLLSVNSLLGALCKKNGNNKFSDVIGLAIAAMIGCILGVFTDAGGFSEKYFLMAALIPMYYMIFMMADTAYEFNFAFIGKIFNGACFILLVVEVYWFCFNDISGAGIIGWGQEGYQNLIAAHEDPDSLLIYSSIDYGCHGNYLDQIGLRGIRNSDVEALRWIKDNTDKKSVIISDKAVISGNNAYYMYGVFCERQQYIEGDNMLRKGFDSDLDNEITRRKLLVADLFDNSDEALLEAKNEGVDYIVQTVDLTPSFRCNSDLLELMYSSDTMNVYSFR